MRKFRKVTRHHTGFSQPRADETRIHIYTDGACEPNPGAGGWAFVIIESGVEINNRNGGDIQTTNNVMEMTAVLAALEYAKQAEMPVADTTIYSDSQYCVKGCNEWRHGWKRKGWTRGKASLANAGLWRAIADAHDAFPCQIVWVRGHSGVPGNERADRLAAKGRLYAIEHLITSADGAGSMRKLPTDEKVFALRADGMTVKEIAERYNVVVDMSTFQRFVSFFACVGTAIAGFKAAPLLWGDDPAATVVILGCVFIVSGGWLLEAMTGEERA